MNRAIFNAILRSSGDPLIPCASLEHPLDSILERGIYSTIIKLLLKASPREEFTKNY